MQSSIPCAVCGSHDVDIVATTDRKNNPLQNVLCRECGLVWVDPRPDTNEISKFYSEDYRSEYKGAAEPKKKHCYREMHRANQRVSRLKEFYKTGDKVLDIGAGAGFFTHVLQKNNVDISGIEPNKGYSEFARNRLGLDQIQTGYLNDIQGFGSYDLITINHVFEHLPEPAQSLDHMHKLLKEDGILIMEVPSAEADYHAPGKVFHVGHLYWYNADTLRALVIKHGFEILDLQHQEGTKHLNIALKKGTPPQDESWRALYAGSYQRMRAFFDKRTVIAHYLTSIPYARFAKKMNKYAKEYQYVRKYDDKIDLIKSIPVTKI